MSWRNPGDALAVGGAPVQVNDFIQRLRASVLLSAVPAAVGGLRPHVAPLFATERHKHPVPHHRKPFQLTESEKASFSRAPSKRARLGPKPRNGLLSLSEADFT